MNTELNQPNHRRLLVAFAHPDDETFGIGGTIAMYARRDVAVHYVCGTKGEVGEAPQGFRGYSSIAEMREAELQCAAQTLGLTAVHFLGYRDSGMTGSPENAHPQALCNAPTVEVARKIAVHLRCIRPQVVITFDPIGGYRHPDHIAMHNATVMAFRMAGDADEMIEDLPPYAPQKLYYATFSRRWLRLGVTLLRLFGRNPRRMGRNKDVDFASLAEVDFPVHAKIETYEVSSIKMKAFACHASQGGVPRPLRGITRWFMRSETFMRAVPSEPPATMEHDLFDGVTL
jgi:LmbE family N-acetylglucosaminyl deacetylase